MTLPSVAVNIESAEQKRVAQVVRVGLAGRTAHQRARER